MGGGKDRCRGGDRKSRIRGWGGERKASEAARVPLLSRLESSSVVSEGGMVSGLRAGSDYARYKRKAAANKKLSSAMAAAKKCAVEAEASARRCANFCAYASRIADLIRDVLARYEGHLHRLVRVESQLQAGVGERAAVLPVAWCCACCWVVGRVLAAARRRTGYRTATVWCGA